MNLNEQIKSYLSNEDSEVNKEWVDDSLKQYPYFNLPALLYLQRMQKSGNLSYNTNNELMSRIAISYPDRKSLYCLLGENAQLFANFYPKEETQATPTTENTIDIFLNTFGTTSEKEMEVLNNLIFNPVPDYADILAAEEQQSIPSKNEAKTKNEQLINDFIAKSKQHEGHFPSTIIKHDDESELQEVKNDPIEKAEDVDASMFSESLAKIYIKQHKYSKALEIITNISLKFPEKSIYFADQIRFLKKLILNEQIKNNK
ncbi:MAG: hypothetical protein ACI4AH_05920 [Muribaculaceae bacterium]